MTCPLMFRFRTVDRLPEAFSVDAVRGTLVHKVLEDLFSLPAADRTPEAAREMLVPTWERFVEDDPTLGAMFDDAEAAHEPGFLEWLRSAGEVLDRYFTLEDPRRLEPAERELYVETLLDSKLLLRGFVDRLDVAPDGATASGGLQGTGGRHPAAEARRLDDDGRGRGRRPADRFRRHGRPVVTVKSEVHHRPCFRVTLRDGSSVVCDNVHQWTVVTSDRAAADPTDDRHRRAVRAAPASDCRRSPAIAVDRGAQRLSSVLTIADLPIDPWLLGAGSGTATRMAAA